MNQTTDAYQATDNDEAEAQAYAISTRLPVDTLRDAALCVARYNKQEAWIVNRAADIKEAK